MGLARDYPKPEDHLTHLRASGSGDVVLRWPPVVFFFGRLLYPSPCMGVNYGLCQENTHDY